MNITKERVEELIKTIQLVAACSPAFMFPQKDYADFLNRMAQENVELAVTKDIGNGK